MILTGTQVNSQVIRPEERVLLKRLVDIMVALEFRFMQEKSEDGQLVYRLEPWVFLKLLARVVPDSQCSPADVFMTYDGKRSADIAISRYAVRHLVASEASRCLR